MEKIKDLILSFIGILLYSFFYKNFIYKSRSTISKYQFKKIKNLLIECSNNVPYYKKLFKDIGFNPQTDFQSIQDLEKIPILNQQTVRENRLDFLNQKSRFYVKMKTSGTSGSPFKSRVSFRHWIVEQSVIWRQWKSFGYKFRDKMAIIRSYAPKEDEPIIKIDFLRNFIFYSPYHLTDDNMDIYYSDMKKRKIKFLRGYPSSIKIFAEYCYKKKYSFKYLKGILLASETLTDNDKIFMKKVFNVPVINHYGLAECVVMIGNIESDKLLYNYEDYGYLEAIKLSDNQYSLIGTNLNNYSMPLIRYNTNDIIEIDKKNNSNSKINFQKIKKILGRGNEYIISQYKKIPLTNIYTTFAKYTEISKFQIIQENINFVRVIINLNSDSHSNVEQRLTEDLNFLNHEKISFKLDFSSNFLQFNEGKIPTFVTYEKK